MIDGMRNEVLLEKSPGCSFMHLPSSHEFSSRGTVRAQIGGSGPSTLVILQSGKRAGERPDRAIQRVVPPAG